MNFPRLIKNPEKNNGKPILIRCIGCKSTKPKMKGNKTVWICSLCCKGVHGDSQDSKCFSYHLDNLCKARKKEERK